MSSTIVEIQHRRPRFASVGQKDDLVDRVVQAIERQILDGRLPPGTRLPPEREFSISLRVSRPVVREAVRILVTRGLLETRHGIGTKVRAISHEEIVKPLTLFLQTCGQEVNIGHLYQVRSILEVENAAMAARQATDADLADLVRICCEMESAASDPPEFALKDSEFHRRLSETTHNPLMILLLDSIQTMMSEVRILVSKQPDLFDRVMPTHLQIVERIKSRDPDGARLAMREHVGIALIIQRELIEAHKT
jgi:GntR family transcriptional repressor for pyruvate dehydrogenase complex